MSVRIGEHSVAVMLNKGLNLGRVRLKGDIRLKKGGVHKLVSEKKLQTTKNWISPKDVSMKSFQLAGRIQVD